MSSFCQRSAPIVRSIALAPPMAWLTCSGGAARADGGGTWRGPTRSRWGRGGARRRPSMVGSRHAWWAA
eukprot:6495451-Prymnesium_polylepis.1